MTATIETMLARSSIRAYTDEKLTDEELVLLKKAALSAPTAMNRNDQRFVFVTDGAVISKVEQEVIAGVKAKGDTVFLERILSRGGKVAYDAPLLVMIFGKPSRYAGIDAGIAVQNLALAAKSLELGSVILACRVSPLKAPARQSFRKNWVLSPNSVLKSRLPSAIPPPRKPLMSGMKAILSSCKNEKE